MVLLSNLQKFHEVYQTCTTPISTLICLQFILVHSHVYKNNITDMDINL